MLTAILSIALVFGVLCVVAIELEAAIYQCERFESNLDADGDS